MQDEFQILYQCHLNHFMKKSTFTIGRKIFGGFIALIIIFAVNAGISFVTIERNNETVRQTAEVINPSTKALDEFVLLVTESKMLITNWVYLQNNSEDKEALKDLQNFRYPALKEQIIELSAAWQDTTQAQTLDSVFSSFETLTGIEKEIMGSLVSFENYEDPMVKLLAEEAIESEVLPRANQLKAQLNKIAAVKRKEANQAQQAQVAASKNLKRLTFLLGLMTVVLGLVGALLLTHNITKPINYIKKIIVALGKGDLPEEGSQRQQFSQDEVGEMAMAVKELVSGLRATSGFAENIGNGQYQTDFTPLSESDVLGNALINMRDNLQRVAEEDRRRNWATEGSAKFGEILRQHNHSVTELSNNILSHLIKYMEANQGGLYVAQDDYSEQEPYMVLEACYAWDRQKYLEQKIYKGEGLVGQSWQEKDTIYVTDVPQDYITISSGLGDANPTSILIVPLIVNDEVYGAIELASFNAFDTFEIEFLEKIAESIASSISSAKVAARTQKLLEESNEMTEQMHSQEEEMRQNMEEMQATQEEMQRSEMEMNGHLAAINSCSAYIEFNLEGEVRKVNEIFLSAMKYEQADEVVGKHHRIFMNPAEAARPAYQEFWQQLRAGINQSGEFKRIARDGSEVWLLAHYTPVLDKQGQPVKIVELANDITDQKLKNIEIQGQLQAIDLSIAVIEFDLKGNILTANTLFLELVGYELSEIQGKHHSIFVDEEEKQSENYQQFWQQLAQGEYESGEFKRINKAGQAIWIRGSYNPILDLKGKPYKVVKFANDVTAEKQLFLEAQQLKANEGELLQKMEEIGATQEQVLHKMKEKEGKPKKESL